MRFEWDPKKAAINVVKHHVSFDEALTVFNDPLARIHDDEDHSFDEQSEIIIGHSVLNRFLLVYCTERADNVIRIFSSRPATPKEREDYEENTI